MRIVGIYTNMQVLLLPIKLKPQLLFEIYLAFQTESWPFKYYSSIAI